jgi:GDP-4-dehydro-6-deoxy-D-mannose reductase
VAGPILVTGAAGFVGGHLVDRLLTGPQQVAGWYRPGTDVAALRRDIDWRPVELLDRSSVARAVDDLQPTTVYHLAAAAHVAQSWQFTIETYQTNVLATHYLLEALTRQPHCPRVLVTCSATIYKPQDRPLTERDPVAPASPYALSKLAQEMLALRVWREDGLPIVVARSFNHTGPGQDPSYVASGIARQIACIEAGQQEPRLRLGNLDSRRDLSDVRDVVRAYVAMATNASVGHVYNICSGRGLSVRQLVETFIARARVPVDIVQDPALLRPNDVPLLVGDHGRLTAKTGWRPQIPFEQTVDDLLEYWRARVRRDP